MATTFWCNLCQEHETSSLNSLLNHIKRYHRSDPNFHVLCGVDGCCKTYRNFLSYRNHLIRKHGITREKALEDPNDNGGGLEEDDEDAFSIHDSDEEGLDLLDIRKQNALCLLKFKEIGRVPQTVVNTFVESSTQVVQNSVDALMSGVVDTLIASGVNDATVNDVKQMFKDNSIRYPFQCIDKEPLQYQYYKDNFNLVEPQKITLGKYHVKVRRGNKLKDVEKSDDAYYVPILDSLQQLLNDDSILEEIDNPHSRNDGRLSDFCDGEVFKSHPLFSTNPDALQLLLYFDEVEVCNPLGSRANKHKIGAFYYTLGNIKPENRSHMNAIQLLAIINTKHLKKYGVDPILRILNRDLHYLERDEGYNFTIHGQLRNLRGTIAYLSGDNLGSQYMGGFKQGSGAHRKCRECMGNPDELRTCFHEDDFTLRTRASYSRQCQLLQGGDHFRKTYGLNQRSLLNDSRYYCVIGGLPADAMHDILEGVLQYDVKEVLKVLITEHKFFTLDELNRRIATFDFGYHNDTNRPAPIQSHRLTSNDNSLKQHASQMWCLGLYLPLLVGDLVPEEEEHWGLLCTLLQIMRIVFSPTIDKDQIPYLQVLIQSHHDLFKQLFPNCSIIPKMHYMVHMPRIILQLGPLVRSWCMRYEAKHHYFKRTAVLLGNWINLPFSLAKRHQEGLCYRLQIAVGGLSSFIEKGTEIGPGQNNCVGDVAFQNLIEAEIPGIDVRTPVYEAKWVTIKGTKYKVGATLHIGYDDNSLPAFWEVKKICIVDRDVSNIMFVVMAKETIQFNEHFQCYEVVAPNQKNLCIAYSSEFSCYLPLNQVKPNGLITRTKFVCLRFEIEAPE